MSTEEKLKSVSLAIQDLWSPLLLMTNFFDYSYVCGGRRRGFYVGGFRLHRALPPSSLLHQSSHLNMILWVESYLSISLLLLMIEVISEDINQKFAWIPVENSDLCR